MRRILFATLLVALPMAAGPLSPFFSTASPAQVVATAVDSSGSVYIAANVATAPVKPAVSTTPGAYLPSPPPMQACFIILCDRGFIAKFSSTGALIFATYLGTDPGGDFITAIAVDSAGNVFVGGGAIRPLPGPSPQSPEFIQKLSADGSALLGSYSFAGGFLAAIAISSAGDVFATGTTVNPADVIPPCNCPFVTTSGALQTAAQGGTDAFAIHLDSTLSQLIYATIIGGSHDETGNGITVDALGEAYITGGTAAMTSFPTTPGGLIQPAPAGTSMAFAVKLNASGSGLVFSAQFDPAPGLSFGAAIAVDGSGVYIAGLTTSPSAFTSTAVMTSGTQFVAKLAPDGSGILAQTLLPGPLPGSNGTTTLPTLFQIAIDASGDVLLLSHSDILAPTTGNSFMPCTAGLSSALPFIAQLNPDFSQNLYGSYLPQGLAIRGDGEVWYSDSGGNLQSLNTHDPLPRGIRCMTDAFTGLTIGPIAPGKLVNLFGPGIGSQVPATQQLDATGKVAVGLNGVSVYFNGIAAPLLSVTASQIEAVVPFENLDAVEFPTSTVVVLNNGTEIDGQPLPVNAVAFSLMTDINGCLSAFNSDGTLNSQANPAAWGSLIAIFGEGAGQMRPAVTGGIGNGKRQIAAPITAQLVDPSPGPSFGPGATNPPPFPTQTLAIPYAGDTPGFVEGIFEMNLLLPSTFATGQEILDITIGGTSSGTHAARATGACVWVKAPN